jgi:FHA domain
MSKRILSKGMLVLAASVALLVVVLLPRVAAAAPEAHVLRIDPRAGLSSGQPELTTVIEVVQFNTMSDVLGACANVPGGDPMLDCVSAQMEKPGNLYSPFPLPAENAKLLVKVAGEDIPAKFVSKELWSQSKDPSVGTAWLVAVDGSSGMGARYREAQQVAHEFIAAMGPNDIMDLIIFDDRPNVFFADSKWKTFAQRNDLVKLLTDHPTNSPSHGSNRPLFSEIKEMTKSAFGSLGNNTGPQNIPLHQAMVVLSNGAGRGDAASASPSADVFHQYLNQGRFPAENTSLPKTPLPVISVWFPTSTGLVNDIYRNNDAQFMQALANTEIGGYYDIVRPGQGDAKSKAIITIVKKRFNEMWIVKWRVSCLNPTLEQTFNLVFVNTKPQILPDGTFKEVPIGIDPTQWPLDINMQRTKAETDAAPIYPGGKVRVYGDFCWGGDKGRAEAYFVPAGTKPSPQANSQDPEVAKQAMQQLIQQGMRGQSEDANDTFAVFDVPDDEKVLEGNGDNAVARVVIYDNKAHRGSGHDEKSVLTLKAQKKPFNIVFVLGVVGLLVVIVLLVLVLMRGGGGGGGGKKGRAPAPQAPVVAGGPPYPGGGYGPPGNMMGNMMQNANASAPQFGPIAAAQGPPMLAYGAPPVGTPITASGGGGSAPQVLQVKCPNCQMPTMATQGQSSVCFSCGQPLPASITGGGVAEPAPTFPLTGAMQAPPLQPPQSPYANAAASATIVGAPGQFAILPGAEIKVGRDAGQCPVFINEPRVSGVHATLKFETARLWAKDEGSNNGTWIDNTRIAPGQWVPVAAGSHLRFGPIEFSVRVDT